jgi:uncharacterized membrane protein YtjA (UPF0391 family)
LGGLRLPIRSRSNGRHVAAGAAGIAKILFVVFLIGAIVSLLMNGRSRV